MDIPKTGTKRMRLRRATSAYLGLLLALIAVLVAGVAIVGFGESVPVVDRSEIWVGTADKGDMVHEIRASGTLSPRDMRIIAAETSGTVREVLHQSGASVSAGTVLIEIANPDALVELQDAKSALARADADTVVRVAELDSEVLDQQAMLTRAESDYRISAAKADAQARAFEAGVAAKMDALESQVAAEQKQKTMRIEELRLAGIRKKADAMLASVELSRQEASMRYGLATRKVEGLRVRAGIDGVLLGIAVEPGQAIAAGAPLARVAKGGDLYAKLHVPESMSRELSVGQKIRVALGGESMLATLDRIDPTVKDGRVAIDAVFDRPLPANSRPDASVEGRLQISTLRNVVSIPRPASAGPNGKGRMFVLRRGDDYARAVDVVYGQASSDRIVVRSGLRAGDEVLLSDVTRWLKYDRIRIE